VSVVQIISASEEHLPAIAELARLIWHECYPGIITRDQIDYMLAKMYSLETLRAELQSGIRYKRLLIDENLSGFASFGTMEQADVFKLHKLYLHPKQHGHGFGTALLQHCENEARNLGARRLLLNVNKRNSKAIDMYQRNGFSITDSVVSDIGNGFVMDDYVMSKSLV
jgi:GNAT superfamily N-acetyltransferase